MASIISRYQYHFLIMLIGLLWFGLINYLLQLNLQSGVYPDAENYKDAAEMIYHHFSFHFYRPVLIAVYCGIPYLFGVSDVQVYTFGIYMNFACWIGTSLLLFGILKSFLKEHKAFYVTLTYFLIIGALLIVFHLLTESFYTFAMMAGFYFLSKYYRTSQFHYLSIGLAIFMLGMLIKPGSEYLAIFYLLYYWRALYLNYQKVAILFLCGSMLLIGLQVFEMKKQYGDFTISYISAPTFYNYLGARAIGFKEHKTLKQVQSYRENYILNLNFPKQKKISSLDLTCQLQHNTLNLLKAYIIDLVENAKTPSDCLTFCQNMRKDQHFEFYKYSSSLITKWQNRLLTVSGFLLALYYLFTSYKKEPLYSLISFYILYSMLLSGLSCYQGDRFHIVFFPLVILLSAKFLSNLKKTDIKKLSGLATY